MPRLSKSKTSDSVDTPVSTAPVSVAPVSAAPVSTEAAAKVSKKVKEPKAAATTPVVTAATTPVVVAPVSTPVTVAPVSEEAVVEDVEASIAAQSVEFMNKLNQFSSMAASLKSEFRTLEKKYARLLKAAQKTNSKKKKRAGNRAPSGFVKPTKISDELAKFLEKPTGTEMARTDVTREINKYIRSHNLQDVGNGRKINPDQKLQTLLKLKKTDELTYFNLQKYMSPHFYKAEKAVVAAAAVTTSA
jgi:chromatin remodeling complex protein RSC6